MNSQIPDASALRRKFVRLFVQGMKERIHYQFQLSFFQFLFVSLPLVFAVAVIMMAISGIAVGKFILLPLTLYAIVYVYSLILLIVEDITETSHCFWEIHFDYPQMSEALRETASMQWDDELENRYILPT